MAAVIVGRSIASQCARQGYRAQHIGFRAQRQLFKPAARSFTAQSQAWEKKYTKDHEWVDVSSDGKTGTIGVSEYAAKALGDVVYVELPVIDTDVTQGDSIGAVESVKSASDIMTPLSGKIVETNSALENSPGAINKSAEGEGWLAKIEISDASELDALMDAAGYKAFTEDADNQ